MPGLHGHNGKAACGGWSRNDHRMKDMNFELVDVSQLKIGMYVELELGWMAHPFPTSSFKISSDKQIDTIRGLGLQRIKFVPAKSDAEFDAQRAAPAPATLILDSLL